MKLPLQVVFRDMAPLPSLEETIRQRAAKLELFVPELMSCQVVVQAEGNRHRVGHRYVVRIDARVPEEQLVAGERQGSEEFAVAVRDAFDAMTRQLEDYIRRRRGQVKRHEPAAARQRPQPAGEPEG